MTFTLNGSVVDQTGTNTSLSGLDAIAGVTLLSTSNLDIYDMGTLRLNVEGTLTINGTSDAATREMLVVGVGGATQNVDINIADGGTLIVGSLDSQGGVEFNQEQFWPSIYEDAATDFGDGNGNISNDGGTTDAFINVEGGGRLEWYGCINSTGGMRFKGANDGSSTDEAQVVIRGGVLDARRLTERGSGEADQFIYNYSDELDIAPPNGDTVGLTILTMTTTGANEKGLAIIQLGEPIALQGFRPVFSSQALGGSNSAPEPLDYTVEDYTGIIGTSGTDNIDLRSASANDANNSTVTFLNSEKGSTLNLATQDPAFDTIEARQTVRGSIVDASGTARADAVLGTENVSGTITEDDVDGSGNFAMGNILLTDWDDSNPPSPTHNNPSGTDDDLWSFYVYSYLGVDRNRLDVRLRGVGGTDIDFITPDDLGISETTRTTVDAYSGISNLERLYDRSKSYKISNIGDPALETPMAQAVGSTVNLGTLDLDIDGDSGAAFAFAAGTITIHTDSSPQITRVGQTETVVQSPEDDEITVNFPAGIQDDDVAYLIIGHAESEDNAWNTPSGWTVITSELQSGGTPASVPGLTIFRRVLSSDSGSVTVTNAGTNVSGIVGQMIVYRTVNTTTPEDVTTTTATGASGDPNPASITPVTNNSMILAIALGDAEQTVATPPSGYTAINDTLTVDGGDEGDAAGSISVNETVVETFSATEQTSHTVNLPTFATNDYVVVCCNHSPDGTAAIGTVTTPTGWTLLHTSTATGAASDSRVTSFGRVMQAGDASTLSISTSTSMTIGAVAITYEGVDTVTPVDVAAPTPNTGTGGANCPSITTVTDNAMVVRVGIVDATASPLTDGDEPAGHTARGFMNNNPPSNGMSLGVADEVQVTAGSAGTALFGNGGSEEYAAATFALRPGAGRSLDGCVLATAEFQQGTAGAEDPGTFDFSESEEWCAATLAIRVDSGGGTKSLGATSKFDTIQTTGDVTMRDSATIDGLTITADLIMEDVEDLTDVTVNGDLTIQTAGTYNFSNVTVTGDITNSDGTGNVTINASNGSSLTTSEPGTGNGEVDIVNTVTVRVTVRDAATNAVIENARVFLEADSGGPLSAGTDILNALSNASGVVEDTAFNFSSDQPVTGRVRKGTASPFYKSGTVSGTITSSGFNTTVFLVLDE